MIKTIFPQLLQKNPKFFSLNTKNLELRLYKEEDVEKRFNILKNFPEITEKMTFFPPSKIEETTKHFLQCKEGFALSEKISWSIFYKKELIGTISLEGIVHKRIAWELNKGVLGYWLCPKFYNNGFMTEAVKEVLAFGFTKLKLNKIEVGCLGTNMASARVIEKSGFRFLCEQKHHFKRDKKWYNHKSYELLNSEWKKQQKKLKTKYIHEREIWLVDLDPTKGIEIQKTRPCLVLKKCSKTHFVIIPLTSQNKKFSQFHLKTKKSENYLALHQIRTVDAVRFQRYLKRIPEREFSQIQKKSAEVLKLLPRGTNVHNESIVKTISGT